MKKATKILTLILVVVFAVSVFVGCNLVGRDVVQYRDTDAMKIGGQTVKLGKLLDTFNNYYNSYSYYISLGYLAAEDLLNMVVSSLVQQYLQVKDYIANPWDEVRSENDLSELEKQVANSKYLSKSEFAYAVKYVNYLIYSAFDQYTDTTIAAKFTLNEAPAEDTSRDFTEYDDWDGTGTYAQYLYDQNFVNEEADEYFEENYSGIDFTKALNLDAYVYAKDDARAAERVKEYNDRRTEDEEDELTVDEYLTMLADTKKQYEETISNNYGVSLNEFMLNQLGDMVTSCIITKWNFQFYKDLETEKDDQGNLVLSKALKDNYDMLLADQKANFNLSKNFDSFITGLSTSSNIFYIPTEQQNKYVFVKNILIPFSDVQTTLLTDLSGKLGGTESDLYIDTRNEFAAEIVAQYFKSDKYDQALEDKYFANNSANTPWFADKNADKEDEDELWQAQTNVFSFDQNSKQLSVNPDGVLGQFFKDNGVVNTMEGKTASETIIELMKRFNTDTAQHTAAFDYVVYVGEDWEDYSHSWVKEFYTAVNEDLVSHENGTVTLNTDHYTLCVSSYGVHIIFLSGGIDSKLFSYNFDKRTDTSDPNYNLFKTYFDTQRNLKAQDAVQNLQRKYLKDAQTPQIEWLPGFDKFLSDNNFEFSYDEFLQDIISEL